MFFFFLIFVSTNFFYGSDQNIETAPTATSLATLQSSHVVQPDSTLQLENDAVQEVQACVDGLRSEHEELAEVRVCTVVFDDVDECLVDFLKEKTIFRLGRDDDWNKALQVFQDEVGVEAFLMQIRPITSMISCLFRKVGKQGVLSDNGFPPSLVVRLFIMINEFICILKKKNSFPKTLKKDDNDLRQKLSKACINNINFFPNQSFVVRDDELSVDRLAIVKLLDIAAQDIVKEELARLKLEQIKKARDARLNRTPAGGGASCGAAVTVASQVSDRNSTQIQPIDVDETLHDLNSQEQAEREKFLRRKKKQEEQKQARILAQEDVDNQRKAAVQEKKQKELEKLRADKQSNKNLLIAKRNELKLFQERAKSQNNSSDLQLAAILKLALDKAIDLLGKDTTTVQRAGQIVQSFNDKYEKTWNTKIHILAEDQGSSACNYDDTQEQEKTYSKSSVEQDDLEKDADRSTIDQAEDVKEKGFDKVGIVDETSDENFLSRGTSSVQTAYEYDHQHQEDLETYQYTNGSTILLAAQVAARDRNEAIQQRTQQQNDELPQQDRASCLRKLDSYQDRLRDLQRAAKRKNLPETLVFVSRAEKELQSVFEKLPDDAETESIQSAQEALKKFTKRFDKDIGKKRREIDQLLKESPEFEDFFDKIAPQYKNGLSTTRRNLKKDPNL